MQVELAKSLAGHDKDQVYVILKKEKERFLLADGVHHTMAAPKSKNPKHLQLIYKIPQEILDEAEGEATDLLIKRIIKLYTKSLKESV